MRLLVDQRKLMTSLGVDPPDITQVDKTPNFEDGTAVNGRFLLPVVDGVEFQIDKDSYVLPVDGSDVSSKSFGNLLASFPMYGHIFFNPFLEYTDIDADGGIDFTKTFKDDSNSPPDPPVYYASRLQTGRSVASSSGTTYGLYPTHTALLPVNGNVTPQRPGLLVSKEIDLTPYTGASGTDEFCLYWKLFSFETSDDHAGDHGIVGDNTPAVRTIYEMDPEPNDLTVYISPDDGVHWCEAGHLEPIAFTAKTTSIRLAFVNYSRYKIYIAHYGVMF